MADSAEKETDAFLQQEAKDGNKGEENDAETVMKKPNGDTAPRAEEEDTDDTDDTDDDDNDDNKDEDDDNDEFSLSFLPFSVKVRSVLLLHPVQQVVYTLLTDPQPQLYQQRV